MTLPMDMKKLEGRDMISARTFAGLASREEGLPKSRSWCSHVLSQGPHDAGCAGAIPKDAYSSCHSGQRL